MDEDVTATDFAQENAISGIVEEAGEIPGNTTTEVEYEPKGNMLDDSESTQVQHQNQPNAKPKKRSSYRPSPHPESQRSYQPTYESRN